LSTYILPQNCWLNGSGSRTKVYGRVPEALKLGQIKSNNWGKTALALPKRSFWACSPNTSKGHPCRMQMGLPSEEEWTWPGGKIQSEATGIRVHAKTRHRLWWDLLSCYEWHNVSISHIYGS
jgi:hypothetical protein